MDHYQHMVIKENTNQFWSPAACLTLVFARGGVSIYVPQLNWTPFKGSGWLALALTVYINIFGGNSITSTDAGINCIFLMIYHDDSVLLFI